MNRKSDVTGPVGANKEVHKLIFLEDVKVGLSGSSQLYIKKGDIFLCRSLGDLEIFLHLN